MVVKRIISLLPSATEIVCALDAGDQLVGRSHECDFPPEVRQLPVCTSAKLNANADSAAIEREVKNLLAATSAIYEIDTAMLERLKPDVILTQAQCEVCAVSLNEVEAALSKWTGKRPQVVSLSPQRLADIWQDFRTVAEALEMVEHGRDILRGLKTRVVNIIEKTCVQPARPTVLCVEWIEPLMAAGNWVPELVELAAGVDVLGQPGKHSAWTNWETIQKLNPEIIIAMPCGFDLAKTRAEMSGLTKLPGWKNLRAVKTNRVYLTDGNQYFNRPGPRIVESLEILTEIIHPKLFNFSHKGKGWEPFDAHGQ
jgi:iron complex transport system substrate-binding protein